MDFLAIKDYIIPIATLAVGWLGEKAARKMNLIKTKKEVETSKITDMEFSLKFWVENSKNMQERLNIISNEILTLETRLNAKWETERTSLGVQVELFQKLNLELKEIILKQDENILELELYIESLKLKISELEDRLAKK